MRKRVILALLSLTVLGIGAWGLQRLRKHPSYLLRYGTPEEQVWAVKQLGLAGKQQAVLAALESSSTSVRQAAIATLELLADPGSRPALLHRFKHDADAMVRVRALEVAVALEPATGDSILLEALGDSAPDVRAGAIRLVCRFGRQDLVETVLGFSDDPAPVVTDAVIEALDLLPSTIDDPDEVIALESDRIVWEAERGVSLRDNFERAPADYEAPRRESDPMFQGLDGHSGAGWLRCLQSGGSNHPFFGGRTGELLIGHAAYPIIVPETGRYRIWARMWFMDKCGDSFWYWVDHGTSHPPNQRPMSSNPREWRNWVWFSDTQNTLQLSAGRHIVHIEPREDGVRFDQFCLVREGATPPRRHEGPLAPNQDPARLANSGCEISISRDSIVIGDDGRIQTAIFALCKGKGPTTGVLRVDGGDSTTAPSQLPIVFNDSERLLHREFTLTYPEDAPCAERVIRASLTSGSDTLAKAELLVGKPWPWQFAGPFPFSSKPRDRFESAKTNWQDYPVTHGFDRYGMMDFQQVVGRKASGVILLQARIHCDQAGDYLWLLNSDDESQVWLDDEPVMRNSRNMPASHRLVREQIHLSEGEHLIRAAIWQRGFRRTPHIYTDTQNYWQFRLRIRKDATTPAPIRGLPTTGS